MGGNFGGLISRDIGWTKFVWLATVVGYASSQRGRVSGYFCVRGKKARVNISRYLMPGLEKGDYNDLPSVKYFLAGKSKKKAGIMLLPLHTMDKWKLGLCCLIKCFFHFIFVDQLDW